MANTTLKIEADEQFLNEVQSYFDNKGINLREFILTYISWYMNVDNDDVLPWLHNLEADDITDDMIQDRKDFKKLPDSELVSYTADGISVS